jgi:hypothetical protein
MGTVRVKLHLDVLAGIAAGEGVQTMLRRRADAVMAAARSRAPVETGTYRRSFAVRPATTDRPVWRVHNDAPYALRVEYGGSTSARSRPLGAALDAAGGDVRAADSAGAYRAATGRRRATRKRQAARRAAP